MKKCLITLLVLVIVISLCMGGIYLKMIPSLKEYGKMEIQRFNQLIISHCYFTSDSQYDQLVILNEVKITKLNY